ncbi:IPT/TIG domain-containing protein [Nocardia niwae]|uniref:IPT/TIG domain-containing protein n=1 Tax=Nocardia niwae TaxID=626084 RepID=A0ABV2XJ17_9NOCA
MSTITSLAPTSGPITGGTSVTITGTGFADTTSVHFGTTSAAFIIDSPTQITATAPAGTGTVQVTVTGPGGTSNGVSYTYSPCVSTTTVTVTGTLQFAITTTGNCIPCNCAAAPTLNAISPSAGREAGGTTVILTGMNLAGATAVSFGSTPAASFTVDSAGQITGVAPAGTGTVQVTVTTLGGTSNAVFYTYVPAPALTSVSPSSSSAAGGTTVTLTGTNLSTASAVLFGSTAATSFTVDSDTQITAVSPAGTGTVQVTVTTVAGTSNGVSYAYGPALTSIFQFQGPEAGGHLVYLNGTGLTGVTAVTFGSTPATSFTVDSDTEIAVFTPAGTGTVQVTATGPNGTSNGVSYTYVPVPILTSVDPTSGPEAGGNTVVLTGTGLATGASVRFGVVASDFTVDSDTQITATAVPGTGTVDITVITAGGTSNGISYTYV